jgi:hypothetical protein
MSLWLRVYQHLLPDAAPWRLAVGTQIRQLFEGLAGAPADARAYTDAVYLDLFPDTTRQITEWENEYGIPPNPLEATRRLNIAAEWAATGGQSPRYIEDVLQTAGFDVYVHEWWSSGPNPYVARDPRSYTLDALVGTVQCGEPLAQCGEPLAECNNVLVNDPLYLVNKDLTQRAPPPIPADPDYWPFFWYVGGETFPDLAQIRFERKDEFHRLLLKLGPAHQWIVTLVDYIGDS